MSQRSPIRLLFVAGFAIAATYLVVTTTLAEFFASGSPKLALRLDSANPTALLASARNAIDAERRPLAPSTVANVDGADLETGGSVDDANPEADSAETARVVALQELANEAAKTAAALAPATTTPPAPSQPAPLSQTTLDAVTLLATHAIERDPLNARAMRLLGEVASASGDAGKAEALMKAAAHYSLRESTALAWLLDKSFERQDFKSAMTHADVLMRTRPQLRNPVTARLAIAAESSSGNEAVKRLLTTNPPWRSAFFQLIPPHITDARMPLDLLLALKDSDAPPSLSDIRSYLDFLVGRKLYDIAYYAWLQFLTPEQLSAAGFVVNGGFESASSGMPFDWTIRPGNGVTVAIEPLPEAPDQHALSINFSQGRANLVPIVQVTMLAPGNYTFSTRIKGQMSGRRGLSWKIACVEKPKVPLAKSASSLGRNPVWTPVEFDFTIPATGCKAQFLKLELDARSASELLVSGAVWYDDVMVQRKAAPAPNAG